MGLQRNGSSAITKVVRTIIEITREQERKGTLYQREKFRGFMTDVNLLAARTRLVVLSEEQLKQQSERLYIKAYS